jgi:hypothetical protein
MSSGCVRLVAGALALLLLAGCGSRGPQVGDVAGKVTFMGKPVGEGTVNFLNLETGYAADAPLDVEGAYAIHTKLGGLPIGTYEVTISPPMYLDKSDPKTPPAMLEKRVRNIPEQYRRSGSPLKADVKEGKNALNFDLRPDAG